MAAPIDLPGLDHRPGKVVQAEILRRFSSPVSFHPLVSRREFFMVLSFGRCVYRLSEQSAALILQAVIGGVADSFAVLRLADRVFRFSVHSKDVGFHIYKLRSFECSSFKMFFNLWHNGGPNYHLELANWEQEQANEWVHITNKNATNRVCLSEPNSIPVHQNPRVHRSQRHGCRSPAFRDHRSVFERISYSINYLNQHSFGDNSAFNLDAPFGKRYSFEGILGPKPVSIPSRTSIAGPPVSNAGPRSDTGHVFGRCQFPPRSQRPSSDSAVFASSPPQCHRSDQSLPGGPAKNPVVYSSVQEFSTRVLGISPPSPITIPWSLAWKISVPEFDDDEEVVSPAATLPAGPPTFATFGEFGRAVLGLRFPSSVRHFPWSIKTLTATMPSSSSSDQATMAYRLVDPAPFMPQGAQRLMIPGRPLVRRVVTGVIQECNNDVAIATLNPLPQNHMAFGEIRNVLADFLNVHLGIPYQSIQRRPYGQAYVKFSYHHHRDFLINGSPHHYGNGTISFIPHNRAWNNRAAIMTHEVWMMMLGLNIDIWNHSLVNKAVSEFGRLMAWEEHEDHMSRILVRARVTSLDSIPWFLNFTEGEGPETQCWSCQCEVLQATLLGAMPQDEDLPPGNPNLPDDFDPNQFHFFGFGQPGQGPPQPPPGAGLNVEHLNAIGWDVWPNQEAGQAHQGFLQQLLLVFFMCK